ncbi:wd-40 repeat protein [Stylonychia lemnae]|uniref:Wd-40 repeat protein n=1 Tax=Stylonychia lemnae TaxID=5949 RepID=A0A078AT38_STYLE|nr:wd-40 repeat protein [Stylonychia lemnae]|eukprot:CDW85176.1 wd-40 repeat protein [Stylonychia lemnae]
MFNEEQLIQPIYPAFHFGFANKILINSSQVEIFIKGEEKLVGYFQVDITDSDIKQYREITSWSNEKIIKELQDNVDKYLKLVAGFGTCFGVFQNNLAALETIVKQLSTRDRLNLPILIYTTFKSQHQDDGELIQGINLDHPKDVHQKYDELFLSKLKDDNETTDSVVSIEYHLINLPVTLGSNQQNLMIVLSETDRPDYFENKVIQSIIKFKWNQYTKSFYQNRFYTYLIFMASFIFDIFYSTYAFAQENDSDQKVDNQDTEIFQPNIWIKISTKAICSIVLCYFLTYEISQIRVQGKEYFSDGWNYFDFSHILAFAAFCILDFTTENQDNLILIKILVIILSFMKLFFFLRIYDGFSFLVQMMAGVFKDLKYFLFKLMNTMALTSWHIF